MVSELKRILYFPIASYFRFFAAIRLKMWNPRIVVVTGSNGKTTLLHMLEAQIGDKAKYSHHANSSFGIPFDILGLQRKTLLRNEWFGLIFLTPFKIFAKLPKEKIYIVEADAYHWGVGKTIGKFLKPEVVLWVSTARTHSMNFDKLVNDGKFATVEEAIAYEFGYFVEYCSKLAVLNGDSSLELQQQNRTKAEIKLIQKKTLKDYSVTKIGTRFVVENQTYNFSYLLPEEIFYAIEMCREVVEYFDLKFDPTFKNLKMPPGRGSIFIGIKNTTIIDSSYNGNLGSITAVLEMYKKLKNDDKWVVIGDMLELGSEEKEEHEKLAKVLSEINLAKIILVGNLTKKYTYPILKNNNKTLSFNIGKEALDYLEKNIKGSEIILFKASQSLFLEGIIEKLLKNKNDIVKLPRQKPFWISVRENKGY